MAESAASNNLETELLIELEQLRQDVARLKQVNSDLEFTLQATVEHSDLIQEQLYRSNQQLQAEARERRLAQSTLQETTIELKQTEAKYQSIFENAAEGIFQTTPEGKYIRVNPALAKIYGYDSPDDIVASISDVGQQLYVQPRRRDELNVYLKQFGLVEGFESEVYRRDKSVIWISENVREVRDAAGRLLYYEGSVQDITDRKLTETELREQRLRAERLLLNVLPQPIAERLKRGQRTIADSFSDVTVLFADIVNFTEISSQSTPTEVVELLNAVFSSFDRLTDRYGLEKVKTIGDAYMVVGGLLTLQFDPMGAMANLALDMLQAVQAHKTPTQKPINVRIGMHVGSVVAGVIGTRKFIYDLWGDAVNVASRMESQGEPGRIQVTETVYQKLEDHFLFQYRGAIAIKGKGEMNTYWLMGKQV